MDPVSAVAAEALVQALKRVGLDQLKRYPSPLLRQLLGEILELGVVISDELDGRASI